MKTENPSNLVQVSYMSCGKPRCYYANPADIATRKSAGGGCVRLYKADGSPQKYRPAGEFDWQHMMLAVGNIVEAGNPRLASGWQSRVEADREAFWREFAAKLKRPYNYPALPVTT